MMFTQYPSVQILNIPKPKKSNLGFSILMAVLQDEDSGFLWLQNQVICIEFPAPWPAVGEQQSFF